MKNAEIKELSERVTTLESALLMTLGVIVSMPKPAGLNRELDRAIGVLREMQQRILLALQHREHAQSRPRREATAEDIARFDELRRTAERVRRRPSWMNATLGDDATVAQRRLKKDTQTSVRETQESSDV